jgi:periplasmic protein TonB
LVSTAQTQQSPGRLVGIGFVILLHIALVYALISGLAFRAVELVPNPIETKIIQETPQEKIEPPPPPPNFQPPPPPFVPPPEVNIATPPPPPAVSTAITNVTPVKPTAPPPPPAPPHEPVKVGPHIDVAASHEPEYPPVSRRLGEQGTVILEVMVEPNGRASDVKIIQSSGFPRLDEAAVNGVKASYRFAPGTLDGKPAAMPYTFKFTWKLQ